jgi:hypothetical protein
MPDARGAADLSAYLATEDDEVSIGPCVRCRHQVLAPRALAAKLPAGAQVKHPNGTCPDQVVEEAKRDYVFYLRVARMPLGEGESATEETESEELTAFKVTVPALTFSEAIKDGASTFTARWAQMQRYAQLAEAEELEALPSPPAPDAVEQVQATVRRVRSVDGRWFVNDEELPGVEAAQYSRGEDDQQGWHVQVAPNTTQVDIDRIRELLGDELYRVSR